MNKTFSSKYDIKPCRPLDIENEELVYKYIISKFVECGNPYKNVDETYLKDAFAVIDNRITINIKPFCLFNITNVFRIYLKEKVAYLDYKISILLYS